MVRRTIVSFVLAGLLALRATGALAAPTNAPTAFTFPVTCGSQTFTIVTNTGHAGQQGQAQLVMLTPGFIIEGGDLLIGVSVTLTGFFNGQEVFSATKTRGPGAGSNQTVLTCTFSDSSTQDGNTFILDGTVTVFQVG